MTLRLRDVFRFMRDIEYSRLKIYEIVRRYDPIHVAAFFYVLENVTSVNKKKADEPLDYTSSSSIDDDDDDDDVNERWLDHEFAPKQLMLSRVEMTRDSAFAICTTVDNASSLSGFGDIDILDFVSLIKRVSDNEVAITPIERSMLSQPRVRCLLNNATTPYYQAFLRRVNYLLFSDNMQHERDVHYARDSVATRFLRFYKMMMHLGNVLDPKMLRYTAIPRSRRVYDTPLANEYVAQPMYHGFHVIVSVNGKCAKTYNRYGEYRYIILRDLDISKNCSFVALILPLDKRRRERSWRYWRYRSDYRLYVVDVLRYESSSLLDSPFEQRYAYAEQVVEGASSERVRVAPTISSVARFRSEYEQRRDPYDSVIGVYYRRTNSRLTDATDVHARFDVVVAYDLRDRCIVEARESMKFDAMHFSLDMAPRAILCVIYAHDRASLFTCVYDADKHDFVHAARMRRAPCDVDEPRYQAERIYVRGARALVRGVSLYRVYYTNEFKVLGYERKITDGKFDLPRDNELLRRRLSSSGRV